MLNFFGAAAFGSGVVRAAASLGAGAGLAELLGARIAGVAALSIPDNLNTLTASDNEPA